MPPVRNLDDIRAHRTQIYTLAHAHGITDLYVFGSFARGHPNQHSDIDMLGDDHARGDLNPQQVTDRSERLWELADALTTLLGRTVDIRPVYHPNLSLFDHVIREAVPL